MIHLTKGNTDKIYFTGSELATISNPYFLFIFTNRITGSVVKFNKANESTNQRIDFVTIITNDYFAGYDTGMWEYEIRQKSSGSDVTISGTVVESGFAYLHTQSEVQPTYYTEQDNTFKTYEPEQ